jgi:hypothetical protein
MKPIYLDNMARAVAEELDLTEAQYDEVRSALMNEWRGAVAIVFTRDDVALVCERNGWVRPSLDEADQVLEALMSEDYGGGVTLDTVKTVIESLGFNRPESA